MIKGLYSAVSAMLMNANRQQVLSHNVANLDTPGFRQILATAEEFVNTTAFDPMDSFNLDTDARAIGTFGLGVQSGKEAIDFSQGGIQETGNSLDVAIQGTAFFHVKTPEGDRYTRDGRFICDASGTLVTVEGYQVLNKSGQPIKLGKGDIDINPRGEIALEGKIVSQLGLAEFDDPRKALLHDQGNLFKAGSSPKTEITSSVVQGALETSNVNSAQIMTQMMEVARAYEAAQQLVQNQDDLLGKTISYLGKIG